MNLTVLLQKLITIERSIGSADNALVRSLVYDAQDFLLQMQKEPAEDFLATAWNDLTLQPDWFRKPS
jgi:hypothetical protein